jgi:hypothetical protein
MGILSIQLCAKEYGKPNILPVFHPMIEFLLLPSVGYIEEFQWLRQEHTENNQPLAESKRFDCLSVCNACVCVGIAPYTSMPGSLHPGIESTSPAGWAKVERRLRRR